MYKLLAVEHKLWKFPGWKYNAGHNYFVAHNHKHDCTLPRHLSKPLCIMIAATHASEPFTITQQQCMS